MNEYQIECYVSVVVSLHVEAESWQQAVDKAKEAVESEYFLTSGDADEVEGVGATNVDPYADFDGIMMLTDGYGKEVVKGDALDAYLNSEEGQRHE